MLVYLMNLVNLIRQIEYSMNRHQRSPNQPQDIPDIIAVLATTILKAAKSRFPQARERGNKPIYYLKNSSLEPSYQTAKKAETTERNLFKALRLYAKSASQGDRIDSCIKDFASVLHQMGYTKEAIGFLSNVKEYYDGDSQKFEHLEMTLQRQVVPSGKHDCRSILFELPKKQKPTIQFISNLFENTTRIRKIKAFNHLALSGDSEQQGKWLVLEFQSFSAAKKTLEKFKIDEWFGIKKYWLRGNKTVTCLASDGREDFEKGLVVTKEMIEEVIRRCFSPEDKITWTDMDQQIYCNECAIMMIEQDSALSYSFEEKEHQSNYRLPVHP